MGLFYAILANSNFFNNIILATIYAYFKTIKVFTLKYDTVLGYVKVVNFSLCFLSGASIRQNI